jgi:hypothetical protein
MDKHASHQKLALLAGMLIGAAGAALAQQAPPNDAAKMIKGTVAQYSLTPGGDVDGLILADEPRYSGRLTSQPSSCSPFAPATL